MTTTTSPTWTVTTDTWALARMREAAAYRAENPGSTPAERATDAYLDAYLAACEDAVREVGTVTERPSAEAELPDSALRAHRLQGSSYGTRNAPSEAQLRYLSSLARDLGYELQTPRDRSHASLIIDGAKKALAAQRAAGTAAPAARQERPATEAQLSYLRALITERETDVDPARVDEVTAENTSARLASQLIEQFQTKPRRAQVIPAHGIAEGRYAVELGGAPARFYRVTRTGRIKVQAGPSEHPYNGQLNEGLRWIADNQRDAAALYGRLLGVCGMCGRELTDEDSRARGLGPVCASK